MLPKWQSAGVNRGQHRQNKCHKNKWTINDIPNTTQKGRDCASWHPLKTSNERGISVGLAVPVPLDMLF